MSEQSFVNVGVEVDSDTLADNAVARLSDTWPGWEPHEGALEVVQIEAIAPMAADAAQVAARVPPAIFRRYGTVLWGIPYAQGARARATTTWTLSDSAGHRIEAGSSIDIDGYAFTVDADVDVPADSFVAGEVSVTAVEEGTAANDLDGPAEPITAYDWVDMITVVGATSGGTDAEADADYQNRLSTLFTLMALAPITESNFALLARFTGVAVGRSLAIDGYDPDTDSYSNGRFMFVAVTDPNGEPLSTAARDQIAAFLEERREANFVVNVANHSYTTIDVIYDVVTYATGYDQAVLEAAIDAAITSFLQPLTWGRPISRVSAQWTNETVVRADKLTTIIDNVPGVNYVNSVVIADHDGLLTAEANGDLQLTGPAPLPRPGTITRGP